MKELHPIKCGGKRVTNANMTRRVSGPKVTVITSTFNCQSQLERCLNSVMQQDYPHIEHILIDGGSTDGTLEILEAYSHHIDYWASEPDEGIYDAWNKGLRASSGEWICFLGADDELLPGAISRYMEVAALYPEAEYVSSRVVYQYPSGSSRTIGGAWDWPKFSHSMCTAHVGSMHRRSLYDRYGEYDKSYSIVADYEFLLRAGRALRAAFMPVKTAKMRSGGRSDSRAALVEQARAKLQTGGCGRVRTAADFVVAQIKYSLSAIHEAENPFARKQY
jgi:glycosyltransferase involved in cell wall biosynthesis